MNRRGFLKSCTAAAMVTVVSPSAMGATRADLVVPGVGDWSRFFGVGLGAIYYLASRYVDEWEQNGSERCDPLFGKPSANVCPASTQAGCQGVAA